MYISQSNGYKYDMANCLYAATVEEILDNCSCKPFFLNWQAKSTRVDNSASLPFCTGPGLLCMKNKMNMWGDENRKMDRVTHYFFFFELFKPFLVRQTPFLSHFDLLLQKVKNLVTGTVDTCYNSCEHQVDNTRNTFL